MNPEYELDSPVSKGGTRQRVGRRLVVEAKARSLRAARRIVYVRQSTAPPKVLHHREFVAASIRWLIWRCDLLAVGTYRSDR